MSTFKPHIEMAHKTWATLLVPGDMALDATCGNGHDTHYLAQLPSIQVISLDIQEQALIAAKIRLGPLADQVHWSLGCHSRYPVFIQPISLKLIVYNLGYLPGSDKSVTTQVATTLESLKEAQRSLKPGGLISITCYPGHPEGEKEESNLLLWANALDPTLWQIKHTRWEIRPKSPSLLYIIKNQSVK